MAFTTKIASRISTKTLKHSLFRGMLLALLGSVILLVASIKLEVATMQKWGWIIFLLSLALITGGLLPYRLLTRKQLNPDFLVCDGDLIHYLRNDTRCLSIPIELIEHVRYLTTKKEEGILFNFKPKNDQEKERLKVIVHAFPSIVSRLRVNGLKEGGDLLIPGFGPHAVQELQEFLEDES